ncbi:MAG TPA: hypothetical protein VFG35_13965 [Actinoplanes sp.]|nr:hypothetical protein [Actinoplanes sp.]
MTPTPPTPAPTTAAQSTPASADPAVVLDLDEAADLVALLDVIEDWLLHADDDAQADLAGFLDGSGHGHLAAAGLITTVGHASLALHRRLRKANP